MDTVSWEGHSLDLDMDKRCHTSLEIPIIDCQGVVALVPKPTCDVASGDPRITFENELNKATFRCHPGGIARTWKGGGEAR